MTERDLFRVRIALVQAFLRANQYDGVLISRVDNFAMATGGKRNYVYIMDGIGVCSLFVTAAGDVYYVGTNIEEARVLEEELAGLGCKSRPFLWFETSPAEVVGREFRGNFVSDDGSLGKNVHDDLAYTPLDMGDPFLIWLWDFFNITENLVPIRGVRSTFTYDLPFFPYGREHPMQETLPLQDAPAEGRLAARYDASGHFVVLTDSFSGDEGEELRLLMEAAHLIVGMRLTAPAIPALLAVLWLIFLP